MFINSEQRARNATAEQAIGTFKDSLNSALLRQKLGPALGRFTDIADRLYVPNVKHGLVVPNRKYRNAKGIAVIALGPSDKLSVSEHFAQQSEKQQAGMTKQLTAAGLAESEASAAVEQINSFVADIQDAFPTRIASGIHYDDSVRAETWTTEHPFPLNRTVFPNVNPGAVKWSRLGLPTILVRHDTSKASVSPSVMLHESVHIDQIESEPLQPVFDPRDTQNRSAYMLTTELPAYKVGAMEVDTRLQNGFDEAQLQRVDQRQLAVEAVRQTICTEEDPFDSAARHTEALFAALSQIENS